MSNSVSGPQFDAAADYKNEKDIAAYARAFGERHRGSVVPYPRVAFLCTLITKELRAAIGGLDERFSPGNYEDDDYCMRAHLAGFKTVIAQDVFIHHFGSKSFLANGKEQYLARLEQNKKIFIEKWGADPDTLWTDARHVTNRSVIFPLHANSAVQAFERAKIYLNENDMARADASLQDALRSYHTSDRKDMPMEFCDLLHIAGNISLLNGNIDRAQAVFEEELRLTPNSSQACTGLGEVFLRKNLNAKAKVMFEYGVQLNPGNTRAAQGLARASAVVQPA
jgi:tetratricopeptide (TPR) repeat protein